MAYETCLSNIISQHKKFLLFLFVVSFAIRAAIFIGYLSKNKNYWQVDSKTYHLVAEKIAQGKGIVSEDGNNHFYRLPGYPLFLALFYYLFGANSKNVLWLQIFVASMIPLLIFLLSLILFPSMILVAKSASLAAAFHIGLILYSGFFMTESLFIFFLLLFFIFFLSSLHLFFCRIKNTYQDNNYFIPNIHHPLSFLEPMMMSEDYFLFCEKCDTSKSHQKQQLIGMFNGDAKMKAMVWAGFFLGIASLIRPVGHYLLIIASTMLFFSNDLWQSKIAKVITLVIAWFLPVSFWLVRNFIVTGHIFFHTLPGGHFLYLSAARVAMYTQNCSYQEARQNLKETVHKMLIAKECELGRPLLEIESCNIHEALALKYFKQQPIITLKNWVTDMFRTMFSLYSGELLYLESERSPIDYFKKERSLQNLFERYLFLKIKSNWLRFVVWGEILIFLFILLGFCGYLIKSLLWAVRRKYEPLCIVNRCLPFIVFFIVIALAGGYARMRLPIEPLIILLSSSFWLNINNKNDN